MNKLMNGLLTIGFFILSFSLLIKADVPPDAGSTRVRVDLVVEAAENFDDFRFFLDSPTKIEEVFLKKGETLTVDAAVRGGAMRVTTLLAIPKKSFGSEDAKLNSEEFQKKLRENKIPGVVKILNHSFQRDIPIYEKLTWKNPRYRLERDGATNNFKVIDLKIDDADSGNSAFFWIATAVAGVFISLAILVSGIWLFRKTRRKS